MSLGGLGDVSNLDLSNLDSGQLQQFLQGVNFPARKEEVASTAEGNGAPHDLVGQIRNSATERFDSPEEVLQMLQGGASPP